MAIWKLTIEDDEGQKTVVPLVKDEYTVGRREGHSIRLTERNISRDHARVRRDGDGYVIEDAGSYNGVFVNGVRVSSPTKLASGDMVVIGDYRIEPHDEEAPQKAPISLAPKAPPTSAPPSVRPVPEVPARLVLLTGPEAGREWHLEKEVTSVGRGDDVDMRVNHSSVSRHHCDVKRLLDNRMELVDCGSANGIRVNGMDVKNATLDSGDLIELGDMLIRYVAAGKPYVYDAVAEAANIKARGRRGGAFWAVVVLVIVAAGIGGVVLARSGAHDTTTQGSTSGSSAGSADPAASDGPLDRAMKLKDGGDVEGAHGIAAGLPKDSPLRNDKRFKAIENGWADDLLRRAAGETDADKKRTLLKKVLDSGGDDTRQEQAKELLGALDAADAGAPPPTPPSASASESSATKPSKAPPTGEGSTTAKPATSATKAPPTGGTTVASTGGTSTPTPPPAGGGCASFGGDYGAAMRAKDYDCVKKILSPKLNANAISTGEARYLKAACTALGDTSCAKRAAEKL